MFHYEIKDLGLSGHGTKYFGERVCPVILHPSTDGIRSSLRYFATQDVVLDRVQRQQRFHEFKPKVYLQCLFFGRVLFLQSFSQIENVPIYLILNTYSDFFHKISGSHVGVLSRRNYTWVTCTKVRYGLHHTCLLTENGTRMF